MKRPAPAQVFPLALPTHYAPRAKRRLSLGSSLPLIFLFCVAPVFGVDPQNGTSAVATLVLHADRPGVVINRNIYGQFAEHLGHGIYGGVWVGENSAIPNTRGIRNDVVGALKRLNIPVLRWPGGCFADEYHWKDGIGPRENRPKMINTHWGGVTEDNAFGTHEFMDLCEQLGCEAYVCGNVGSGSPQEMMEWVEYMTSDADSPMTNLRRQNGRDKPWKVAYFGVGNESWGCGGNMRPEYYADEFRRFNTFVKNYPGSRIYRIASGANVDDYHWTTVLMSQVGRRMNGLSLHYYTVPSGDWGRKGSAIEFGQEEWAATFKATLRMDDLITRHSEIMDANDPDKRIGLVVDEWGTWFDVEKGTNPGFLYQQSTLRDALVAALNFHIFHKHAGRVVMANIAQMANVLQSMVLTDGEKMLVTPTYWVFEMYKVHQGATFLPVELQTPDYQFGGATVPMISASASRDAAGVVHLSLVNTDPNRAATLSCELHGLSPKTVSGAVLTAPAMNSHNTFEAPETVHPQAFHGASLAAGKLSVAIPSQSVVMLELN
jgi:alpha-L-arabinofuranosidase